MATIREVWAAYDLAQGRWSGCDWPTRFGSLRLDLEGISSLHARAATRRWRALAADEAACEGATAPENAVLAAMGLCLRLRCPAVRPGESSLTTPMLAPRPPRHRCAEALADEWELAACVLEEIESDACLAEQEAWAAVRAAERGDWGRALRHARCAFELESGYQALHVWGGLQRAIQAAARGRAPGGGEIIRDPDGCASLTMQQKERSGSEQRPREATEAQLGLAVLRALGRPDSLWAVQVRWLWADNYRVKVFTGADASSAVISHSYFLTADDAGEILEASPAIERRY